MANESNCPEVTLGTLMETWRMADCTVLCRGNSALAAEFATLHRFRGALGRFLAQSASAQSLAGHPCVFDPPCAFDVFHNAQGEMSPGRAMPKPFVIRADAVGDDLALTVRLFGHGVAWAAEFMAGMIGACGRGLDVEGAARKPLPVIRARRAEVSLAPTPDATGPVQIVTVTPLVRRGHDRLDTANMLAGLEKRAAGLACWHGANLQLDLAALRAEAEHLSLSAQSALVPFDLSRGPRRDRKGAMGALRLPAVSPTMLGLLWLAGACHTGADTAAGAGRITLAFE